MLDRGLVNELEQFHDEYNRTRVNAEENYDYTRGIFQAIGFKEFHEFLLLPREQRTSEHGEKLFQEGKSTSEISDERRRSTLFSD